MMFFFKKLAQKLSDAQENCHEIIKFHVSDLPSIPNGSPGPKTKFPGTIYWVLLGRSNRFKPPQVAKCARLHEALGLGGNVPQKRSDLD